MGIEVSDSYRIIVLITFALYILAILGIVFFSERAQKKASSSRSFEKTFFNGGRRIGGITLGLMMMATMLSSGTFVGTPGSAYKYGFSFACTGLAAAFGFFFVLGGIGKKAGIVSRRIESVSLIGLIKNRFNNSNVLAVLLAVTFLLFLSSYSATQIVSGARVFEVMTGKSYIMGLLLFGLVVGLYSFFGGMKSVAAASIFQGMVMIGAVIALVGGYVMYANVHFGSLEAALQSVANSKEGMELLATYSPVWSPRKIVSMIIMGAFSAMGLPHVVQGATTYKNTKALRTALCVGIGVTALVNVFMTGVGPFIRIFNPNMEVSDYATPFLTFLTLPAPVAGVILSGVAASIQSTIAGMLLILSATIAKDMVKDVIKPDISDEALKKVSLVSLSLCVIVVIVLSMNPPELVQIMVLFAMGGMGSSIAMPLVFGFYWRRMNEYGAIAGVSGGLIYYILASKYVPALALGMNAYIMSTVASVVCLIVGSLLTPPCPKGVIQVWFGKEYDKEFALRK